MINPFLATLNSMTSLYEEDILNNVFAPGLAYTMVVLFVAGCILLLVALGINRRCYLCDCYQTDEKRACRARTSAIIGIGYWSILYVAMLYFSAKSQVEEYKADF
jgi:multisubunit Na+/H+ antiporter MnhB subunit